MLIGNRGLSCSFQKLPSIQLLRRLQKEPFVHTPAGASFQRDQSHHLSAGPASPGPRKGVPHLLPSPGIDLGSSQTRALPPGLLNCPIYHFSKCGLCAGQTSPKIHCIINETKVTHLHSMAHHTHTPLSFFLVEKGSFFEGPKNNVSGYFY